MSIPSQATLKKIQMTGAIAYALVLVATTGIIIFNPYIVDGWTLLLTATGLLLISGLGIGHKLAGKAQDKWVGIVGAVGIATVLAFLGLFALFGVAYWTGVNAL